MDTDALLQPIQMTKNQVIALMDVVKANTAALKEIKIDLSLDSQKIQPWVKVTPMDVPLGSSESEFYGQYTVDRPLNPDNPVPWPPGYTPPAQMAMQQTAVAPPPPPPPPPTPPPVHEKEKASETKHKK